MPVFGILRGEMLLRRGLMKGIAGMLNGVRILKAAAIVLPMLSAGCASMEDFNQVMASLRFYRIDINNSLAKERQLQDQIEELRKLTRQMQHEYDIIYASYQDMQVELNDQKDRNAALSGQLAESKKRADKLADDLKSTGERLAAAQKEIDGLKDRIQTQEKQLIAKDKQLQDLEKQSKEKIAALQSDLAGLAEQNRKLTAELETFKGRSAELEKKLAAQEKDNKTLTDRLDAESAARKEVEGKLAHANDTAGRFEILNKALMVRVTELEQQVRDLKNKQGGPAANPGRIEKSHGVTGLITAIKNNIAMINVGKRHGLTSGQKLAIYRSDKFLGYFTIDQLEDEVAGGTITEVQAEIVVGDRVTSDLPEKFKTALAQPPGNK